MKIVVDDADFHSIVIENQGLYYADLTRYSYSHSNPPE